MPLQPDYSDYIRSMREAAILLRHSDYHVRGGDLCSVAATIDEILDRVLDMVDDEMPAHAGA